LEDHGGPSPDGPPFQAPGSVEPKGKLGRVSRL